MKKGNLLLIIIAVIIVLMVCVFAGLIKLKANNTDSIQETHKGGIIKQVTDRNDYYMVENCVNKYYQYCAILYSNKNKQEEDIERVYNLLDEKYINFKNITKENLPTLIPEINETVVNIYNMYVSKQSEDIYVYMVKGLLREELTKELKEFQILVQIDLKNETFSILLEDYINAKHKDIINVGNNFKTEKLNYISQNRDNIYVFEEISNQTYALDLVERYKEEALYNKELAYEHLDEEYKTKKFGSMFKFEEYTEKWKDYIPTIKITEYQITEENGYTQCVCVDQHRRYYIFRITGLMQYSLLLDTYTIDLPEFLTKYNTANSIQRVAYNIQKCLDAINSEDYEYVYNKLDFEFKAVNYPIIEKFEEIIKNNLFSANVVKAVRSYTEGYTHIYKLTITDKADNNKEKKMTVIMQLKEGTDFVMSFSFDE